MLNFIICEFAKLKHAKIVFFSIAGTQAVPFMLLVEAFQLHQKNPDQIIMLETMFENSLLYVMLLMNIIICVALSSYLFSREYVEKTIKNLITLPVFRRTYISGKFLSLLLLVELLMIATWSGILVIAVFYQFFFELDGFFAGIIVRWLLKFIIAGGLLFLTISPFAYIAEKSKGLVTPIIIMSVVVMGSAALCNQELGALYPWTATYLILSGRIAETGYPIWLSTTIIALTAIVGFGMTYYYFEKEDLR